MRFSFFCTLLFVSLFCYCGPVGIEQASNSPVFSIRRVQHFPGFIFVSRKLLYFETQESVVLRFQPVCIAVRSILHKLLLPTQSSVTVPELRTVSHFPALRRVRSTTGQPSVSIKIVMCLFSFPHRTVLWFDNCTMFPLCFSTRRRHSFSAHRKKRGRLFRRPPEKPPVSYYSKSAALFLQLGLYLGQRLLSRL